MKQQIKNTNGEIIFECEADTLKEAVEKAVEEKIGLVGADLFGANLRGANLVGANLVGADLRGANLLGANLRGANLVGADLIGANLLGANLVKADLIGANLNAIFYQTKITKEQKEQIINSDLFEVEEDLENA